MKHYRFDVVRNGSVESALPISDGHSFIFSFSSSAYRKAKEIQIILYFKDTRTYRVKLTPSPVFQSPESRELFYETYVSNNFSGHRSRNWTASDTPQRHFGQNDANVVVRVEKTFPSMFVTDINGERVITISSTMETNNEAGRVDMAGVAIDTEDEVAITLSVFRLTEHEKAEAFAEAMRNPDDIRTKDSDDVQDFEDTENDATGHGNALAAREKALEQRERDLGGDGAFGAQSSSRPSVCPPDADVMKLSATMAWSRAVNLVLGSSLHAEVQKKHDTLMQEWVTVVRGDNISSNAYGYFEFVYSHGVVWPKAILESTTYANLSKVREKHAQIIALLEEGLNALRR